MVAPWSFCHHGQKPKLRGKKQTTWFNKMHLTEVWVETTAINHSLITLGPRVPDCLVQNKWKRKAEAEYPHQRSYLALVRWPSSSLVTCQLAGLREIDPGGIPNLHVFLVFCRIPNPENLSAAVTKANNNLSILILRGNRPRQGPQEALSTSKLLQPSRLFVGKPCLEQWPKPWSQSCESVLVSTNAAPLPAVWSMVLNVMSMRQRSVLSSKWKAVHSVEAAQGLLVWSGKPQAQHRIQLVAQKVIGPLSKVAMIKSTWKSAEFVGVVGHQPNRWLNNSIECNKQNKRDLATWREKKHETKIKSQRV